MGLGVIGYRVIGAAALGLASLGAVLPLLPTVPFVLVAAWAFARGSPDLHLKLRNSPKFGPPLRAWEDHGAISRRSKTIALVSMAFSWGLAAAATRNPWIAAITGLVLLATASFVATRPSPPPPDGSAATD